MWPGPYGDWGSRKYLIASLDQSLERLGLEYVDIFYHHRPDPETPLEETMGALDSIVRQGKALYAGISAYPPEETRRAIDELRRLGSPCLIHQPRYSMFDRTIEEGLLETLRQEGVGCIVFSPLAQGLLTDKYLDGIPAQGARLSRRVGDHRREAREAPRFERAGGGARSIPGAYGPGLGPAPRDRDLGPGRGQPGAARRGGRGVAGRARALGGRAEPDRRDPRLKALSGVHERFQLKSTIPIVGSPLWS